MTGFSHINEVIMTKEDLIYIPHNFPELKNEELLNQHKNMLDSNQYSSATNLLNQNPQIEGFRAGIFNTIEEKIVFTEAHLETKTKDEFFLYKETEPTNDEMNEKIIWSQPY